MCICCAPDCSFTRYDCTSSFIAFLTAHTIRLRTCICCAPDWLLIRYDCACAFIALLTAQHTIRLRMYICCSPDCSTHDTIVHVHLLRSWLTAHTITHVHLLRSWLLMQYDCARTFVALLTAHTIRLRTCICCVPDWLLNTRYDCACTFIALLTAHTIAHVHLLRSWLLNTRYDCVRAFIALLTNCSYDCARAFVALLTAHTTAHVHLLCSKKFDPKLRYEFETQCLYRIWQTQPEVHLRYELITYIICTLLARPKNSQLVKTIQLLPE